MRWFLRKNWGHEGLKAQCDKRQGAAKAGSAAVLVADVRVVEGKPGYGPCRNQWCREAWALRRRDGTFCPSGWGMAHARLASGQHLLEKWKLQTRVSPEWGVQIYYTHEVKENLIRGINIKIDPRPVILLSHLEESNGTPKLHGGKLCPLRICGLTIKTSTISKF